MPGHSIWDIFVVFGKKEAASDPTETAALMADDEEPRGNICMGLCRLLCCPPCPSAIVAKLAFLPPNPPSYRIEDKDGVRKLLLLGDGGGSNVFTPPGDLHLFNDIRTRRGNTLAAMYLEIPGATHTLLFSHGNAVDIGQMAVFLTSLGQQLGCSIFLYDYSGYGQSTGDQREANLYADITAAWGCLRERFGIQPDKIILYGQSIGTVPTVYFAAKSAGQEAGAVILHSPLMSGLRVLRPDTQRTWCCDPFPSIKRIKNVRSPTLIIHGTQDEVIDIAHGKQLHEACDASKTPLWVHGAGHNDIEMYHTYVEKLTEFIMRVKSGEAHGVEDSAVPAP